MSIEALSKLAASGNVTAIEEKWLIWLEDDSHPGVWQQRAAVLDALVRQGKQEEAVTLAGTAIEQFASKWTARQAIGPATAFLLAIKKSDTLRKAVGDLYLEAYTDTPGLEALLDESGIYAGRPVRRAVRTLDVCLQLREQCHLAHRDEHTPARVTKIETDPWKIEIIFCGDARSFGPVELADQFEPAAEQDYRVLAEFFPDRLKERLIDDPASVVIEMLNVHGGTMDSDQLARWLRGRFIAEKDWTKWWTRTRQALKATHRVEIEGRTPYYLTYREIEESLQERFLSRIKRLHDARRELAIVDECIKACTTHGQTPDTAFFDEVRRRFVHRADVSLDRGKQVDLTSLLAEARVAQLAGDPDPDRRVIEALAGLDNPAAAIRRIEIPQFWPHACDLVAQANPQAHRPTLQAVLPNAPLSVADDIAQKLVHCGADAAFFAQLADQACRNPVELNEALLWFWSGPQPEPAQVDVPLVTLLTRILAALAAVDQDDTLPADRKKAIRTTSREVLRARRYERFRRMLTEIETGMAAVLRTDINRSQGLSRANTEDMLKLLNKQFPSLTAKPKALAPKWKRDNILYCTRLGKQARQKELDELVNVKIRENAIAIGKAADMGDLSENSEYKFALEERDLLHARLAQIQKEMEIARVITDQDISDRFVDIGSRVVMIQSGGDARHEFTILGPLETDIENMVFNYQTPIAQTVLGAKVGEEIESDFFDPPGRYRIERIENALAAGTNAT